MARQTGDRTRGPDAGGNRPDAGTQRPIEYKKVPEQRNYDRTRPMACDRMLVASDQLIMALTVRTTGRVRSGFSLSGTLLELTGLWHPAFGHISLSVRSQLDNFTLIK